MFLSCWQYKLLNDFVKCFGNCIVLIGIVLKAVMKTMSLYCIIHLINVKKMYWKFALFLCLNRFWLPYQTSVFCNLLVFDVCVIVNKFSTDFISRYISRLISYYLPRYKRNWKAFRFWQGYLYAFDHTYVCYILVVDFRPI